MAKSVHAVILAAGLSSRMGSPKQLLPYGEASVLQTVVGVLSACGLEGIHAVLGHRRGEIAASLADLPVNCVENAHFREGMFSSVLAGMAALPDSAEGMMLVLGDQPQIRTGVVRSVLEAFATSGKGIVVPVYEGRRGHPIILDLATYRPEILRADPEKGLKPVVRGHPDDTLELPVDDPGILRDIDTRADYLAELERRNSTRGQASE